MSLTQAQYAACSETQATNMLTYSLRWIDPTFIDAYKKWCSKHGIATNITIISQSTKGFWLGNPTADNVMVYFHGAFLPHPRWSLSDSKLGGGFAFGGNDGHLSFWSTVIAKLAAQGVSLSVLFVAYPLMPQAFFPQQFQEAVISIRYVLGDLNCSPSQVIIAGDSAGGNLAAAAMLHAMRPSNLAPALAKISVSQKLKGLVLISPWVSFDVSLHSFKRNRNKDYLKAETEKRWSDMYINKQAPSPYNEPALASPADWKDLPVIGVLVTAGSNEVLIDGIDHWVKDLQVSTPL
jgi:hypothetical protein